MMYINRVINSISLKIDKYSIQQKKTAHQAYHHLYYPAGFTPVSYYQTTGPAGMV